jgi:hypothetical protein
MDCWACAKNAPPEDISDNPAFLNDIFTNSNSTYELTGLIFFIRQCTRWIHNNNNNTITTTTGWFHYRKLRKLVVWWLLAAAPRSIIDPKRRRASKCVVSPRAFEYLK